MRDRSNAGVKSTSHPAMVVKAPVRSSSGLHGSRRWLAGLPARATAALAFGADAIDHQPVTLAAVAV
jgi:hypothetical protein